ncbi:MAG: hypothetical protein AAGC55_31465, partial [Myxococcota bacterium]
MITPNSTANPAAESRIAIPPPPPVSDATPTQVSALADRLREAAAVRPLAIIIDDCQNASAPALAALESAVLDADSAHQPSRIPLWLCVATGPELLRRRPDWGQRGDRHVKLELSPLAAADARRLAASLLLPAEYPPAALLDRLVEMSAGNPYFLVELCRNLKRLGMIRRGNQAGSFYVASEALGALSGLSVGRWLAVRELALMPGPLAALARVCAILGSEFCRDELRHVITAADRSDAAATPLDVDVGL